MKHLMIALSDPAPGLEDDFNEWYTGTHLQEIVDTPGFVSAQLYKLVDDRGTGAPHQYLAVYEAEGDYDEVRAAMTELRPQRAPSPEALGAAKVWWYSSVSHRVAPSDTTP